MVVDAGCSGAEVLYEHFHDQSGVVLGLGVGVRARADSDRVMREPRRSRSRTRSKGSSFRPHGSAQPRANPSRQ